MTSPAGVKEKNVSIIQFDRGRVGMTSGGDGPRQCAVGSVTTDFPVAISTLNSVKRDGKMTRWADGHRWERIGG